MTSWGQPCVPATRCDITVFGMSKTWHRDGVEAVKYAEMLALRTDYGRFLARRREPSDFQTYACRPIRGTTDTYSLHSWPRAVDIRPSENPMREDGILVSDFTRFGLDDGVAFVRAFLAAGFRWGGTWSDDPRVAARALANEGHKVLAGRCDTMHFELDGDPVLTGWASRLRAFRRTSPVYFRKVLSAAGATTPEELLDAWRAGKA